MLRLLMAQGDLGKLVPGRYRVLLEDLPDGLSPTDEPLFEGRLVVFPVSSPWMVLRAGGQAVGLAPPRQTGAETDERRWIVLRRDLEDAEDEDAEDDEPSVHAVFIDVIDGSVVRTAAGFAGEGWSLEPHACTLPPMRPWTWIDPLTWQGSALRIRHGRSREEVRAWLADHAPLPYEETSPDLFEDSDTSSYRGHLAIHDGLLELHQFHGTREALGAFEGGLLVEIAAGVLGPVVWDLTDEDWHVYLAAGDDGPSLGRYLDPRTDETIHRAHRTALITPRTFEVAGAASKLALLQAIAAELALGQVGSEETFAELLRSRATSELPRSWLLRVHPALDGELDWFAHVVYGAQPRLRLSWQVALATRLVRAPTNVFRPMARRALRSLRTASPLMAVLVPAALFAACAPLAPAPRSGAPQRCVVGTVTAPSSSSSVSTAASQAPLGPPASVVSGSDLERIAQVEQHLKRTSELRWRAAVDAQLVDEMALHGVPGVGIAVFHHRALAWTRSYGVRDAVTRAAVDEQTLFQAGSISKSVTSLATLRLLARKALPIGLDDDIDDRAPGFRATVGGAPVTITLRQLLSHSAGLTVHGFLGYADGASVPTVPDVLAGRPPANSPPVELAYLPGSRFSYSGGGYTVLQALLVAQTGRDFPTLLDEEILRPLEMTRSTFAQPLPATLRGNVASAHAIDGQPIAGRFHVHPELAAAGLWSTPHDLALLAIELSRAIDVRATRIIPGEIAKMAFTPQAAAYMGLGFLLQKTKGGGQRVSHSGITVGFHAEMSLYPGLGAGVIVMTNGPRTPLLDEIVEAVRVAYGWPEIDDPDESVAATIAEPAPPKALGTYEDPQGFRVTLASAEGRFVLTREGVPTLPLFALGNDGKTFRTDALDLTVVLGKEKAGKVGSITLRQGGKPLELTRARPPR